jgi:hypothetical protein
VGGNVVWLLACLTSWGAVFFLAVMLQTVLGLRPLLAGLVLVPIYLVMMVGSPLAGRTASARDCPDAMSGPAVRRTRDRADTSGVAWSIAAAVNFRVDQVANVMPRRR